MKLLLRPIGRRRVHVLYLSEFRAIWPIRIACTHHTHCCRTNFFQTVLRNTFAGYHVNTQLSERARARRWTVLVIQTDYSTPAAALGRRAHSHREALSLAAVLVDKVLRCAEPQLLRRRLSLDAHQYMHHGEWWSPCIYIIQLYRRNHNDSSPLRLWLCRTSRRHSKGASTRKGGTLRTS